MEALKDLIDQRDELEEELKIIEIKLEPLILASKEWIKLTSLDYDKPMIDNEGFPRADLDFTKIQDYRNLKREQSGKASDCSQSILISF